MTHGAVRARGLVKRYGRREAVAGVDLDIAEGTIVAIVGANGAGKSTLLRMLATLMRPDAGDLAVAGHELPGAARAARGAIGYLSHEPLVYRDLTVHENLELFADLYGVDRRRVGDELERVGLLARSFDPVRTLSRGMVQRLTLARMLLHRPRLLLLDEPYAGLDAAGAAILDAELDGGPLDRSAVLVSHDIEGALARADRVVVMRAGRVLLDRPTADLDPALFRRGYEEFAL